MLRLHEVREGRQTISLKIYWSTHARRTMITFSSGPCSIAKNIKLITTNGNRLISTEATKPSWTHYLLCDIFRFFIQRLGKGHKKMNCAIRFVVT